MKFALEAGGGATTNERKNAMAIQAMHDGYQQEDVMNDTLIPHSVFEPPEHKIAVHDHMKYTWKRISQMGMIIGKKVQQRPDNNSLFTGKANQKDFFVATTNF